MTKRHSFKHECYFEVEEDEYTVTSKFITPGDRREPLGDPDEVEFSDVVIKNTGEVVTWDAFVTLWAKHENLSRETAEDQIVEKCTDDVTYAWATQDD